MTIFFSDEAQFLLPGYVNKQNWYTWGEENPHMIHETLMHAQKKTMRYEFWSSGVIASYFFENNEVKEEQSLVSAIGA